MRLSHQQASARADKGWLTKRKHHPSYGRIVEKRGKTYWARPNGENVHLKRFKPAELQRIQPGLAATDRILKPHVRTDLSHIERSRLRKSAQNYAQYSARGNKPSIMISKSVVSSRSRVNPAGLLAHEIGHSVFPGTDSARLRVRDKNKFKDYEKAFGYNKPRSVHRGDIMKYKPTSTNLIRKSRTRQGHDPAEDFAESFRHLTGQHVSQTKRYWQPTIDHKRLAHMQKYYINQ